MLALRSLVRLLQRKSASPTLTKGGRQPRRRSGSEIRWAEALEVRVLLAAPTPVVEQTFTGTTRNDFGAGSIPDTMGSVGPLHAVELLNNAYAVYDKSNGQLISRVPQDDFWNTALAAGGGGTTAFTADPRVIYDPTSGHWFATALDRLSTPARNILVGVSNGSDPTAGWKAFLIDPDSTNLYFADFPMLGVDADGVYITASMHDYQPDGITPNPPLGVTIISIPKGDLTGGSPTVANATIFENVDPNVQTNPTTWMHPVVDFGPSDGRQSLISGNAVVIVRTDVLNADGPGPATLTARQLLSVSDGEPPDAPQPGTTTLIETGASFLRSAVYESNNTYWLTYPIDVNGRSAIRWTQIDAASNTVMQSGVISDPDLYFYYPSIAVNTDGDVVIGFSGSSSTQAVSSYFVAGATTNGSTAFGDVTLLRAGNGSFLGSLSGPVRWGDYSSTVIDPENPDLFWTFQEYVDSTDTWGISVSSIFVDAGQDPPVILTSPGTTAYTDGSPATVIDSMASVTDTDSPDLDGGTLTVTLQLNGSSADRLAIRNQGTEVGQIGISGTDVTYGGTTIGTFTGGVGTTPLVITLNASATPAAADALARNITFANVSSAPSTATRTVRFVITDGDGGTSGARNKLVSVTAVNDPPVVTTSAGTTVYSENQSALVVDGSITVTDADSASFSGGTLTIDFAATGTADDFLAIRFQGTSTGQINTSGSNVRYGSIIIGTFTGGLGGQSLVITLNSNATPTNVQALARNITFVNTSDTPYTGDRTVRFVLTDGVGGTSAPATKTVTVQSINDVPVITIPTGTTSYTENGAPVVITSTATIADVDSVDFDGGLLTVDYSSGGTTFDRLSVLDQGAGAGQIGLSGGSVTYGGTIIGRFAGGTGTSPLFVSLNSSATLAAVQALIRSIAFANVSDNPSGSNRTVRFVVTDGDGGTSAPRTRTVSVTTVNDPTVVTLSSGTADYAEGSAPIVIDPAATVSDVDNFSFFNGSLTVDIPLDGTADDRLSIRNEGTAPGQISISGNAVRISGVSGAFTFAHFSGGTGTSPLVISFDVNATITTATLQALVRNITFANVNTNPPTVDRAVRFVLVEGNGTASPTVARSVHITVSDTMAVITPSAGSGPTYVENDPPLLVDPLITVTDPDGGPFNVATLTIDYQIVQINGTPEDRLAIRNVGTGVGEIGVSGNTILYEGVSIGSSVGGEGTTPLVVTFNVNNANATLAASEALLRNVTYSNVGDDGQVDAQPFRIVRFQFKDSFGAPGPAATKTVQYTAVDDDPIIATSAGASEYVANSAAIVVDSDATATDPDATVLSDWNLFVDVSANGTADDRLAIRNQGTGAAQIGISGEDVTYGGTTIGRFSGGIGTTPLSILLNDQATLPALQQLVRNITFENVNSSPSTLDRTVRFELSNALGGSVSTATKTVALASPNAAPVVGAIGGPATAVRGQEISIDVPFTDAGTVEPHTATIDWGDGTITAGIVVEAGGAGTVSGSHTYGATGTFPITVTVIDSVNQSDSETRDISIAAVQLVTNPQVPTKTDLMIGGTISADTITLINSSGKVGVTINGVNFGLFAPTARILVFGHDGDDTVTLSSAITLPAELDGGDGNDTLTGGGGPDILQGGLGDDRLNGGSGNDTLIADAGNDMMIGGAGNDTHVFDADLPLGSDTVDESGGGTDTLDFSATTDNLEIHLNSTLSQEVTGNLTLTLLSGTTLDNVIGGAGSDVIVGNDRANTFDGGAGFDLISGLAGNDRYLFDTDTQLDSDTIVDSAGNDTIDFSATTSLGIAVDIGLLTSQVVNANLTLELHPASAIENVIGGALADTLRGNALSNVLTGGGGDDTLIGLAGNNTLDGGDGNDTLTGDKGSDLLIGGAGDDELNGGTGNDTYKFDADTPLGSDSIIDTAGTDAVDFSATGNVGISISLGLTVSQVVNSNLTLTLSSTTAIENANGGARNDSLSGNSSANRLVGNGGDDLLAGGPGNDVYVFDTDVPLGVDSIVEDQNAGLDLLDFSATTTRGVSVDLTNSAQQVVNSNLSLILSTADMLEYLTGGSQADTLIGNAAANRLTGGPGDDLLVGGGGNDVYLFDTDVALGSDTLIENSSQGIDLLDFSATSTRNVVLNLSAAGPQVVNDRLTLTIGGNQEFENITGGALHDQLTGNSLVNVLTGGAGNDTLEGLVSGDTLIGGAGNDTLNGGGGDDNYLFDADSALGSDTLVEDPGALGGVDILNFSATTGVGITLDLASTAPQVLNARLTLTLSSDSAFEIVLGTGVADTIHGNSLNNALFGGKGNDTLRGFGGRDLLVGGSGADSLYGGDDDDLLIAGLLSYYNESTGALDRTALDWIMAEWTRLDADYPTRISHLRVGGGLNGTARLTATTVPAETSYIDTLFGEAGLDWFWSYTKDVIGDLDTGGPETVG